MKKNKVFTFPVGQLQSNCYIYQISEKEAVVIDPGDDDQYIISKLLQNELTPVAILATHGHYDHIMAAFSLQTTYSCPFYIHKNDDFLLTRMRETAIHFGEVDPGPAAIVRKYLKNESFLRVENCELKIISTPGHTPGSVSYYDEKNNVIFVGDLLFADGSIGEVTHKYSDRTQIRESIKKLLRLPKDTVVYPGHGESATVSSLREQFKLAL